MHLDAPAQISNDMLCQGGIRWQKLLDTFIKVSPTVQNSGWKLKWRSFFLGIVRCWRKLTLSPKILNFCCSHFLSATLSHDTCECWKHIEIFWKHQNVENLIWCGNCLCKLNLLNFDPGLLVTAKGVKAFIVTFTNWVTADKRVNPYGTTKLPHKLRRGSVKDPAFISTSMMFNNPFVFLSWCTQFWKKTIKAKRLKYYVPTKKNFHVLKISEEKNSSDSFANWNFKFDLKCQFAKSQCVNLRLPFYDGVDLKRRRFHWKG